MVYVIEGERQFLANNDEYITFAINQLPVAQQRVTMMDDLVARSLRAAADVPSVPLDQPFEIVTQWPDQALKTVFEADLRQFHFQAEYAVRSAFHGGELQPY